MANETVDIPCISIGSSLGYTNSSRISTETSPQRDNRNEESFADEETVKIEVNEDDSCMTIYDGDDDGVKIEQVESDDDDDQPLTEALAKEMED